MKNFARLLPAMAAFGLFASMPVHAIWAPDDVVNPNKAELDYRPGKSAPAAAQMDKALSLKAQAKWNRYGTIHSLIRHGGFLGSGLTGSAPVAAREWIRQNHELFKLSEAGVADLELVNDGVTPDNEAHAVLFRQKFGNLKAAGSQGLITVGVVNGKVYYVSSTSAGDQPLPSAATLSPAAAWLKAANNVNRFAKIADIEKTLDKSGADGSGWTLFKVLGFTQEQRARLVGMPMPEGGVRAAYETVVLDVQGGQTMAYVHYIDAATGEILRRENRVLNAAEGVVPAIISGDTGDSKSCAARHDYAVSGGAALNASLVAAVAMIAPTNAVSLKLFRIGADGSETLVAKSPATTGPAEVLTYQPSGGVPEGNYQLEVCGQESFTEGLLPYNYTGVMASLPVDASPLSLALGADSNAPQWKFFTTNPSQTYDGEDVRKIACFAPLGDGGLGGCDVGVQSTASKAPWDVLYGAVPTFTTIGNNAITAGGAYSPLTPSNLNLPLSPTRKYDFPFNNAWYNSGCSPIGIVTSQIPNSNGNDLSAVTVNLFVMHNRMHDFAYHLGFTEKNYNLQLYNFGLTPVTQQNDPEIGTSQSGAIAGHPSLPTFGTVPGRNNANQIALMDGVPGLTNQYLFQPVSGMIYGPCSDGALDTGIAGHEYTHAISNRMVAGPDGNLGGLQAGSMGESWGDLTATEYQFENGFEQPHGYSLTALAAYTTGNPERGIRNHNLDNSPLNYGNVGYDTGGPEVHSDGEIWNGTQWELRNALMADYEAGFPSTDKVLQARCAAGLEGAHGCPGNRRWIQLVFDAFLLLPGDTTMLDARDAMLASDMARFGGANQKTMWRVFAHRGMGMTAYTVDTEDPVPVPSFQSPLEDAQAVVTFKAIGIDEKDAPVTNARIIVGQYATRSRGIADTDPATVVDETDDTTRLATQNLTDTATFVPGTYDFMVAAPGYGIHRFTQELKAGNSTVTFKLPSNWASTARGAVATSSASLAENADRANETIDDSEDTGAIIGDEGNVIGAWLTVDLGQEREFSHLRMSVAGGPTYAGRMQSIRSFELRTCEGECADPTKDYETVVYTSAPDAFAGGIPRPFQPDMNIRGFDLPVIKAQHVQLRVLHSQCSGNPAYQGDIDNDPLNNTDCMGAPERIAGLNLVSGGDIIVPAAGSYVRLTDLELFSSLPDSAAEGSKAGVIDSFKGRFGGAFGLGLLLPLLGLAALRRRKLN